MAQAAPPPLRVAHENLRDLARQALQAVGIPAAAAQTVAEGLTASDLRGVESHGVARLPEFYVKRVQAGLFNAGAIPVIVAETDATATIDGDGGIGFIPGRMAMELAISKAESRGVAMVAVRNSRHFGPGFYYAMLPLARDMLGLAFTTGGRIVSPPGGSGRTYGANVIAFGAPGREFPFVLDMATSVVAGGRFETAGRRGERTPMGWAIDAEGNAILRPDEYFAGGSLLPLGGDPDHGAFKGFGLALMIDCLCSLLSGGVASPGLAIPQANHCFAAIRIEAFTALGTFLDGMDAMLQRLRTAPRLPNAGPLTIPGEQERQLELKRLREGIPLAPAIVESLKRMCGELNIAWSLD